MLIDDTTLIFEEKEMPPKEKGQRLDMVNSPVS